MKWLIGQGAGLGRGGATVPSPVARDRPPAGDRRIAPRGASLLEAMLFLAALLAAAELPAQIIDPNFRIHLTPEVEGPSGSVRTVECLLDIEPSGSPLAAWSLGICHDAAVVAPVAAVPGAPLATVNNGSPAEFIVVEFDAQLGVVHGAVICLTSCATLEPPVAAMPLVAVDYALVGEPGSTTVLATCNSVAIGGNPVPTIVVTASAASRTPIQDPGVVTITTASFTRGDCGGDGDVTIADAIVYLAALFGPSAPLACADACDSNDDGLLNIADAVRTLAYLFSGAPPLATPFPDCGPDPTEDAVGCEVPPSGC